MKEATEQIVAEEPKKSKKGTAAKTEVEGAAKVKTTRTHAPRVSKDAKFRLLHGVDPKEFKNQRGIVLTALAGLGHGHFTVEQVASKTEGLVSKTPVEASTRYHLLALAKDGKVELLEPTPVVKDETIEVAA